MARRTTGVRARGVVRLATRGSPLARVQAEMVSTSIRAAAPGTDVELVVVRTEGDRLADQPLERIGGRGVFTKEVEVAVLEGRADVAVHSAKDLPSVTPPGMVLAAVPRRADPRDALVGARLADLVPGAVVATGSARRRAQLANLRPDLTFVELRGNMATRVRRAEEGDVHAVVVALAALDRLGWADRVTESLSTLVMLPQAGQGALALECRADDGPTGALLALVDNRASHRTVDAERALLAEIGGSCTVPVAAWAEPAGAGLRLHGLVATGDGRVMVRSHLDGDEPFALGRALARQLIDDCGGSLIEEWRPAPDRS
ncbi:MAG: hydroxymethylbilane synthase [Acidimicrobiales bacterium]